MLARTDEHRPCGVDQIAQQTCQLFGLIGIDGFIVENFLMLDRAASQVGKRQIEPERAQ